MNNKRPHPGDGYGHSSAPKRHQSSEMDSYRPSNRDRDYDRNDRKRDSRGNRRDGDSRGSRDSRPKKEEVKKEHPISRADAEFKLPKSASDMRPRVPHPTHSPSIPLDSDTAFPALPPIREEFREAVFTHKSLHTVSRELAINDVTYERLEFVGDAYLELLASRLIDGYYPYLPAGRMSQLRELLVKNETLAEYSKSYGMDKKIRVGADVDVLRKDSKGKGNKGWTKILGDVMEAYVAAVIKSDPLTGFETAERWFTALWAPKLLQATGDDRLMKAMSLQGQAAAEASVDNVYDPEAKATLQKRIMYGSNTRITYETDKPTIELKGDKIGQNIHFIALYVESELLGVKRKLLAKAEGKNKVEAGNWAAIKAMYGPGRSVVEDIEKKVIAEKERKAMEKEARVSLIEGAKAEYDAKKTETEARTNVKGEVKTEVKAEHIKLEKVEW